MSKVSVFDMKGKVVAETEISDAVFGITPNEAVMVAVMILSARVFLSSTKRTLLLLAMSEARTKSLYMKSFLIQ